MLTPVPFERFGGLNVTLDPEEVGSGAINIRNIDPAYLPSRLVGRPGFVTINPVDVPATITGVFPVRAAFAGDQLLVLTGATLRAYTAAGAAGPTQAIGGAGTWGAMAAQGVPGGTRVYAFTGPAWRTDMAAFTAVAAAPNANFAVTTPLDNRIALGYIVANDPLGGTPHGSRVRFSDAGDGDAWSANSYVDLHPGDAGTISGMAVWGNDIYVLKTTGTLYVFYGNSTDATGNPIFNFRTVRQDIGYGLDLAAGHDGVYILGSRGVFRSRGGVGEKVSEVLDPIFEGYANLSTYWAGTFQAPRSLTFAAGRLYVFGDANPLVYCPATQAWSSYTLELVPAYSGISRVVSFEYQPPATAAQSPSPTFAVADAADLNRLARAGDASATTADAFFQTGFLDFGRTETKEIRELLLEGTGAWLVKAYVDWSTTGGATTTVTLPSPGIGGGRARVAVRGRLVSYKFTGNTDKVINRVVAHIRERRPTGVKPT